MNNLRGMQPTLQPATDTNDTNDMDSLSIQSMDWLFKKERIYLLAQFWQQVSPSEFSSIKKNCSLFRKKKLIN